MPVSKANPPTGQQVPPSSVSIGKKPMNYLPNQPATAQQQQQPKSARAASKAPVYNTQQQQQQQNRHPSPPTSNAGAGTKARGAGGGAAGAQSATSNGPTAAQKGKASANKIWSTSTTEERERIKDFWLGLGEQERRNLVKIEKDTVLRKMKEQQKHSCSCAVCGRKRNAIEEELEVLYDAYYEELEQYANYQQRYVSSGGTIPPPPGPGPFPGSVELDKNGAVVAPAHVNPKHRARAKQQQPRGPPPQSALPPVTNGRKQQTTHPQPQQPHPPPPDEEEQDEEEYEGEEYEEEEEEEEEEPEEEEEDDEEEDDEEEEDAQPRQPARRATNGRVAKETPPASRRDTQPAPGRRAPPTKASRDGLFNIGSSLTVTGPGNILTVADDLLKNDGQKFLEMMEQLAERRMQREEEAAGDVEDESDDESDDDRDGSDADDDGDDDAGASDEDDEDDDDDEEEEIMTEEQKMEEGKKMFSIFAARMFEQRVLQAYREKVAQERQLQLLRELDEEDKTTRDREMKKQTQNQKKKDKKRQQKLVKEEEKAAKTAEKAAEEAATKARQAALEEENRKRREDERLRREAAKKAAEEEKTRKDEEKRKRQLEERERELERERKKKEKDERLKKEREERERKAKEEREAKLAKEREERVERERIEKEKKEERERAEKEKKLQKEKDEKAEREAKEKLTAQRTAAAAAAVQAQAVAPKTPVRANTTASSSSSSSALTTPTKTSSTSVLSAPALQRTPNNSGGSNANGISSGAKKVNNKSVPPLSPGIVGQGVRPPLPQLQQQQPHQQPHLSRPPHLPLNPLNPQQLPPHLPPPQHGMMYGHPQGAVMMAPALSPRIGSFPPMQYPYGNPNMQHHPPGTPLAPSVLPQGFNAGPPFDPAFNRGMPMPMGVPIGRGPVAGPPAPIGPPKAKTPLAPTPGSSAPMLAPGSGRRASMPRLNNLSLNSNVQQADASAPAPGPITRPLAPIARPMASGTSAGGVEVASSGSGSPNRRSPSPKGVLGSSALAADDDEVVPTTGGLRRVGTAPIGIGIPIGGGGGGTPIQQQSWGPASPRSALTPWGPAGGFSPSPARAMTNPIGGGGPNSHLHGLHHPGAAPVPPIGGASLWANTSNTGNGDSWHPQGGGGFFPGPNQYMNHHNAAASSAPHTGA